MLCFEQAVALDSRNPGYHANLGEACRRLGEPARAAEAFARAVALAPELAAAQFGLANALKDLGRFDEAIEHYKATLRIEPGHARAFYNLGNTFLSLGQFRSALSCYQAAVALAPDHPEAHNNLGVAFKELEQLDEAIAAFHEAIDQRPAFAEAWRNLGQAFEKQGDIDAARRSDLQALDLDPDDALLRLATETLCPVIPANSAEIDRYWADLDATLTRYLERDPPFALDQLRRLDGVPPSLTAYHGRDERAFKERWAALFTGRGGEGEPDVTRSREDREEKRFEPGFQLRGFAASRDIPGRFLATPERRVVAGKPHIGFVVTHGHDHLYLCVQNLRKVQPDFDAIIGSILRGDPRGRVLFIEDAQPRVTERLRRRFAQSIPDLAERIRFLPRMGEAGYLNLVAVADVALDTLHYGGGANTTYDALAVGTPIVTLPGRFHRGRWANAACQRIGVTDGIAATAEDYVAIALRLASEPDYRHAVSARITGACPVLFEDQGAVDELAAFFSQVI